MTRAVSALAILAALTACAAPYYPRPAEIYRNAAAFMNKKVRICGYAQGISNFTQKPAFGGPGFSLEGEAQALRDHMRAGNNKLCLIATVGYVGCASGEELCVDWAYNFILYVDDVRPWQRLGG